MNRLNQREHEASPDLKRNVSILVEFPDERFESLVVQWNHFRPTVLIQLKKDPREPVQFPGLRPHVAGNESLPKDKPSALDFPLQDFIDATTGKVFGREPFQADLLFSMRAFLELQPEPDLVLSEEPLWECRREALSAVQVADDAGLGKASI